MGGAVGRGGAGGATAGGAATGAAAGGAADGAAAGGRAGGGTTGCGGAGGAATVGVADGAGGVAIAGGGACTGAGGGGAGGSAALGAAGAGATGGGAGGVCTGCAGRAAMIGALPLVDANSSAAPEGGEIVITPPQTEQRARTVVEGTRAGSTRKTERHSGQATFTRGLPREPLSASRRSGSRRQVGCPSGGRSSRPSPGASWRSSSFPLQVR